MNTEKTKTINLIQELNTPIEEHEIKLTENQIKVIKTKYLRDDPSPKFWLSNVAKNIALSELIHKDKFLKKALENVSHVIKEYDVYGKKQKIVLFHNNIEEYSERCKNFDKFVKNLEKISDTDSEAKQIVNEMHVQFYNLLANFYMLPNSPTLMNAGRDLQQLSACFRGDQPIMTADGIKPIIEVKKGDKVLTHKGNFKKVIRTMERLVESYRIINIWKMPNQTLAVSDEHPILCLNKTTNNTEWKFAADITTEDHVAVSYPKNTIDLTKLNLLDFITKNKINYEIKDGDIYKINKDKRCPKYGIQIKPIKSEVEVDYDLMKIFGYYLSEGDIDEDNSVRFTFNCSETEYMEDLINLVEKKFGLKSKIIKSNSGNWSNVKLHSIILTQVFYSLFGKGFNKKFIPNWVLELPVEKQKGLLTGIIRGDGYPVRNKNNTNIRTSLCNANLVYGIWVIFARMGILGNFKKDKIPSLGTVNPYKCVIDSFNSEKVFDEIFINRQFNGISQLSMRRVKELLINNTFFLPVKDINVIYEQTKVYNFEVEDEHTYVANNIAVHNCFVIPIEDSIEGWMKATTSAAIIHRSGGGTGFAASNVRPAGSMVKSTKGVASGPLSPLKIIDEMTNQVKQGGCVSLDTRISTENGLIKIGEIVPKILISNSWARHKNGMLTVMTDSGPKISDEVYNNGFSEVITLKTSNGYSVTATPKHRFRVIDEEGNYVWKHLKDIKENDWLALQLNSYNETTEYKFPEFNYIHHPNAKAIITPSSPTIGLGEIIGYFIGDGSVSTDKHGTHRFILSFGDDEQDVKDYIHKLMLSTFGILPLEEKKENDNSTNSFYNRTILVEWLKNISVDKDSALTADVPEIVFRAGREFAKGFLRGLFTADGTISEDGYISLCSVSEKLIDNTQQLLLSLGMPSLKSVTTNRESSYSNNPLYHLRIITERGVKEFSENVKFLSEKKNKRLKTKDIKWEFNDVILNQENKLKLLYNSPGRGCAPGKSSKNANRKLYRDIQHYLPNIQSKRNLTYKRLKFLSDKHVEINKSDLSWFLSNNQFYDQVKFLSKGMTDTVDLSVPENNTYIANGFVSHNTRRGANMGILHCTHPNIKEFIKCKNQKNFLENFNISVAITKEFMNAVENNSTYDLIDPHTKKVVEKVNAKEIFNMMVENAWATGDPGFVVIDRINETNSNPTPHVGMIESTNPCGEQPLLSFEPCNLASINLSKFVKNLNGNPMIDYESLGRITRLGTRFLDNVIDINNYPLPEIELIAKTNRRIGLGVMGWAEMLVELGLSYNSPEAYKIAEEVMSFINETSLSTSEELAKERGLFINFPDSIYDEKGKNFRNFAAKPRNCARTTIAPTGTIAITAGLQGSGIEPFFAVVYVRYDAQGIDALKEGKTPPKEHTFFEVNPYFENIAKENNYFNLSKEDLWMKIANNHGSIQNIQEIPKEIQRLFLTSHDLEPLDHVKIQVAFQKFTDNAVSKTINLKHEATADDVRECYMLAYKHGCKGVTIYRDGSKSEQVLNLTKKEEKKEQPQVVEKPKLIEGNKGELSSYYQIETGQGPLHIHINYDNVKGPKKIFVNLTPIGTEISGMATALGILISKYLELGGDPLRIIKHLNSIKSDKPFGFGPKRVDSVAHGIAVALRDHLVRTDKLKETQVTIGDFAAHSTNNKDNLYCSKCFSANVAITNGCAEPTCFDCGYSKCS